MQHRRVAVGGAGQLVQPPAGQRAEPVVTDGPYGETKELFGGFFLLDVASKQEAVEWAKRAPAVPGSKIEVRRVPEEDEVPQDTTVRA